MCLWLEPREEEEREREREREERGRDEFEFVCCGRNLWTFENEIFSCF